METFIGDYSYDMNSVFICMLVGMYSSEMVRYCQFTFWFVPGSVGTRVSTVRF